MQVSGEKVKSMYEQMMDEHDSEGRSHELERYILNNSGKNPTGFQNLSGLATVYPYFLRRYLESVWRHEHAENSCGCEWFAQVLLEAMMHASGHPPPFRGRFFCLGKATEGYLSSLMWHHKKGVCYFN